MDITSTLAGMLAGSLAKKAVAKFDMSKFTPMNIRPVHPTVGAHSNPASDLGTILRQRLAKDERPSGGNPQWVRTLISFMAGGNRSPNHPQAPPRQSDGVGSPPIQRDGLRSSVRSFSPLATAAGMFNRQNQSEGGQGGQSPGGSGLRMPNMGAIMATRLGGVGAGAGMAAAATVGAAGLLAGVFLKVAHSAKQMGEAQIESLKHLRMYNGEISAAYGREKVGEHKRNRQKAETVGGSQSALVDAIGEMKDSWAPFENTVDNIQNKIGIVGAKVWGAIGTGLSFLAKIAEKAADTADNTKDQKDKLAPAWQQTINDLAKMHRQRNTPKGKR